MLDETRAGARTGAGNRWPHREAVVAQILLFSHAGNLQAVLGGDLRMSWVNGLWIDSVMAP